MSEHELLSKAVAAILEFDNVIFVTDSDEQVVAYSYEPPHCFRKTWNLAVKVACELCPWLTEETEDAPWSMNLFTTEGLWAFPAWEKRNG